MKLKSCAFTKSYKGCYLHQRTDGTYSWTDLDHGAHPAKSWRAAQLAVTAYLKKRDSTHASPVVPQIGV